MRNDDAQSLAFGLLAASRALVDGVSAGIRARGFGDVRPAHGFAFARLSAGGATITQLAEHLDVTRQAAAQLVEELIALKECLYSRGGLVAGTAWRCRGATSAREARFCTCTC